MIGNSSSGIIESPSFKFPVINIGTRQSGKLIPKNVINSNNKYNNIKKKVEYGLSNGFKNRIKLIINPYQVKTKTDISKILIHLHSGIEFSNKVTLGLLVALTTIKKIMM